MMKHYIEEFVFTQRNTNYLVALLNIVLTLVLRKKRFYGSGNNNYIIVNNFISVKNMEINFERKTLEVNIFTIKQVINEYAIFDVVDLMGFNYNLQPEKTKKGQKNPAY